MKSDLKYPSLVIVTIVCAVVVCAAKVALGAQEAIPDTALKSPTDATTIQQTSSSVSNAKDSVSLYLGKYHLIIPRNYFASGPFSVQVTNHLVLDVQLPDIRPMTDEERNQFAKTGLMSPDTAHIILQVRDDYIYDGDKLFSNLIRDKSRGATTNSYLSPEDSGVQNLILYKRKYNDASSFYEDVYLLRDSSPKFFFECKEEKKFMVKPGCVYYGDLGGNIQFQISYDKKHYFNDIVALTPKIKCLLVSFIKP